MDAFKVGDKVTYLGYEGRRQEDGTIVVLQQRKRWSATVARLGRTKTGSGQELFVQVDAEQPGCARAGTEHQVFVRMDSVKLVK